MGGQTLPCFCKVEVEEVQVLYSAFIGMGEGLLITTGWGGEFWQPPLPLKYGHFVTPELW